MYACLPCGLFYSDFPTKVLHELLMSLMRATLSAHRILLDFIIITILGEVYKL